MAIRAIPVVDLFAGAGLLSSAFADEGFKPVQAVEKDPVAAATYARNLGSHIDNVDIAHAVPRKDCRVIVSGPPCQGFSTLGSQNVRDPRNRLCLKVADWAELLQPEIVVIENVAAFLEAPIWKVLARRLRKAGYCVSSICVNAFDFGVPQFRNRSFTFASKRKTPHVVPIGRGFPETVRQAWKGLPEEVDDENHHTSPVPSELAFERMKVIPPGGDKRDIMRRAPHLAPRSWWRCGNQVTDVWGRMEWDRPANTLRTCLQNPSKGRYIHPERNRVVSLREAARLHSISDDWVFEGLPTQVCRQIGNGVPVALGRAVARAVRQALR